MTLDPSVSFLIAARDSFDEAKRALLADAAAAKAAGTIPFPLDPRKEWIIGQILASLERWHAKETTLAVFEGAAPPGQWVWMQEEEYDDDSYTSNYVTLGLRGDFTATRGEQAVEDLAARGFRVQLPEEGYDFAVTEGERAPVMPHPLDAAYRAYKAADDAVQAARKAVAASRAMNAKEEIAAGTARGATDDQRRRWVLTPTATDGVYLGWCMGDDLGTQHLFDARGRSLFSDRVLTLEPR